MEVSTVHKQPQVIQTMTENNTTRGTTMHKDYD
jgi:hypothetical protein